jgi:hypothetical protein
MNGNIVTQLTAVRLGRNFVSVILPFDYVLVLITDSIGKELQKEVNIKFSLSMLCRHAGGVEVWLLSFIISILDGGEWSKSRSGHFIPGNESRLRLETTGYTEEPVWTFPIRENRLSAAGIRTADRPACRQDATPNKQQEFSVTS